MVQGIGTCVCACACMLACAGIRWEIYSSTSPTCPSSGFSSSGVEEEGGSKEMDSVFLHWVWDCILFLDSV